MSDEFVPLNDHERELVDRMLRVVHGVVEPGLVPKGGAWYSNIIKAVHKAKDNTLHLVSKVADKVVDSVPFYSRIASAIEGPRENFRPQDRKLLEQVGSQRIIDVTIGRTPVFDWIHTALGVMSFGKWPALMKQYGFDRFFHLFLILSLEDGTRVKVEKNEVITITRDPKIEKNTETMHLGIPPRGTSLNAWLADTRRLMGDRFFTYDALGGNNCQDFVKSMLEANSMWTDAARTFVYQDISELSRELDSFTKRASRSITDLAARANIIVHGKGVPYMGGGDYKEGLGYKLFKWLFSGIGNKLVKGAEDRAQERARQAKERGGNFIYDATIGKALDTINKSMKGFSQVLDSVVHKPM